MSQNIINIVLEASDTLRKIYHSSKYAFLLKIIIQESNNNG